ncbi:MAG: hypothetical protein ACXWFO_00115 [Candidatus Aminicenantales bacterium]
MSDVTLRRMAAGAALLAALAGGLRAQRSLFYLELQAVAAYSSAADAVELFSLTADDIMQKPGIGFDFVQRLSARTRDVGVLAVQGRLVYDQKGGHRLQPQLYNAYLRLKPKFANIWIGHNRPALGLSSVLDNHALVLPDPTMLGYSFDRDWGLGLDKDFSWGGVAASLTAGSGMPLYLKGNYLAAARVFEGVLARDNYSVGMSLARGNILETMGYTLVDPEPFSWTSLSVDASYVWRNLENRAEILFGRRGGASMSLLFWRSGLSLLEEGRLKVEVQPVLMKGAGAWNYSLATGLTYLLNADLTGRFMVLYDRERRDARFAVQLYYYKRL